MALTPDGDAPDAPRPQPLPTRRPPAHAAPDNAGRVRILLYGLTALLLVVAALVWVTGRNDDSGVDVASEPGATAEDPAAGDDAGSDEADADLNNDGDPDEGAPPDDSADAEDTSDASAADPGDDTEVDATDDGSDDAAVEDDPDTGDDNSGDDSGAEDAGDTTEDGASTDDDAGDDTGPVDAAAFRSDPDAETPDDAPADVAESLAAFEAGEVIESRGIVLNGRIFLIGAVPDEASADAIVELAGAVLGPANIYNYYVIDPRAGDATLGNLRVDDQVLFQTGSTSVAPEFEPLLNQALALMTIRPGVTLTIIGHTDDIGSDEINQTLSEERAEATAQWLIDRGIAESRITTVGAGESDPIASNDTDAGRAANRRIEVTIENLIDE